MLFISRLNRLKSCFPSHFCFLVIVILLSIVLSVSFLVAVMRPPSCFCTIIIIIIIKQEAYVCYLLITETPETLYQ